MLYVTSNSSSGSKYYDIQTDKLDEFTWADEVNQEYTPNYSHITVTDTSFTVRTLRSTNNSLVDEVTLFKARVTLSATDLARGQTLAVTARGLTPGGEFAVTAHSQETSLGTITADDSGTATLTWAVPESFEFGEHEITVVLWKRKPTDRSPLSSELLSR